MVAKWLSKLWESCPHVIKSKDMNQRGDQGWGERAVFLCHSTFIKEDLEEAPWKTSPGTQMSRNGSHGSLASRETGKQVSCLCSSRVGDGPGEGVLRMIPGSANEVSDMVTDWPAAINSLLS